MALSISLNRTDYVLITLPNGQEISVTYETRRGATNIGLVVDAPKEIKVRRIAVSEGMSRIETLLREAETQRVKTK